MTNIFFIYLHHLIGWYKAIAGIREHVGPDLSNTFFNNGPHFLCTYPVLYALNIWIYTPVHHQYSLFWLPQDSLDGFLNWSILRNFLINENKTSDGYFWRKRIYPNRIIINNTAILWSDNTIYLRVYLHRRLTYSKQIRSIMGKLLELLKIFLNIF